jgi:hypothetical protein
MIDIVSIKKKSWHQIWLDSPEYGAMLTELDTTVEEARCNPQQISDDGTEFATSLWE